MTNTANTANTTNMTSTPILIPLLLLLALITTIPGCASSNKGYTFGSNHDQSIKTIAIPIFKNNTLQRGIEVQLTESLNKQVRARTPWSLTKSANADTTLVGVITSYTLTQISQAPRIGLPQELAVRITVNFEWRDNRTGDLIIARNNYSATSTFVPQKGVGERIEHGQRQAIEELAQDLISQLRQSW